MHHPGSNRTRWLRRAIAVSGLLALLVAGWLYFHHASAPEKNVAPRPTTVWAWPATMRIWPDVQKGADVRFRFDDPFGMAVATDGNTYVADGGDSNRIYRIAPDGVVTTLAGNIEGFADGTGKAAAFNTPSGLALDRAGNLYVADTGNHAIRKITPDGIVTTLAGNGQPGNRDGVSTQAQFDGPMAVAVDTQDNVYVADTYNDRIRRITPQGQVTTVAGGAQPGFADGDMTQSRLDTPCGLIFDAQDNLYIADTRNHAIRILQRDGRLTTLVASAPKDRNALLRKPLGLAITHDGMLYVSSMSSGAILQIDRSGRMAALPDGTAGDAGFLTFALPSALALQTDGSLLVADAQRSRIMHITPATRPHENLDEEPSVPVVHRDLPWPVMPHARQHEIVGTLGEVRGDGRGEMRDHLHAGLDVQASMGTPVQVVFAEKVQSPLANGGYGESGEGLRLRHFGYIHMRVGRDSTDHLLPSRKFVAGNDEQGRINRIRVRRGTRFDQGEVLGTVNRMYHTHLEYADSGVTWNLLALGAFSYRDTIAPTIAAVRLLDEQGKVFDVHVGRALELRTTDGPLRIVVDAYDQMDGDQARRKLGVYNLEWQLLSATGTELPQKGSLQFLRLPEDDDAVKVLYAEGSGIAAHGAGATRFLYDVTRTLSHGQTGSRRWQLEGMAPGAYVLRILARDAAGNTRSQDVRLHIQ